ncbi:MAG: flagellar basal-body MS-ring/collar protein FliF [Candidatus Syntrophopropionicum ammoniitolerans]
MTPANLLARLRERWESLNQSRKVVSVLVVLGVVISVVCLGRIAMQPAYAPLFTGLESKEAGMIAENLKTMKVYQITDQGKTIMVPERQVYEVRSQLAGSGALSSSIIGFELFDQSKFGQTDFEQQVGYQRALQGELSRTVVQLDGVEQAWVHLVLPEKSVFLSEQGTPSASVALKLESGALLKPEQIQGICDLFVGSVAGLEPDNVHIIDTEGNILSDNLEPSDPGSRHHEDGS